MTNVLVIPSGTEIALEVHDALCRRRDIELFGAESTDNSHAGFVFLRNARIPDCSEDRFLSAVQRLVSRDQIEYVFPAHDDVQLALLRAGSELGCVVVSSPLETIEVTRFKSRTYDIMEDSVRVPARLTRATVTKDSYPVFIKPDRGQGSQNAHLCRTPGQLDVALQLADNMLICEYLPGREVTVDCFSDRARGLLFADARLRTRTRAGISVRSEPTEVPDARDIADKISSKLRLFGAWFFQLKERTTGEWVLLEIGARIPGGATYQRLRGVNLPLLSLFEHQRRSLEIFVQPFDMVMDRAFVSRFRFELDFQTLYVDFDDTLCLKGEPNAEVVALTVVARARGKDVVLLSRNERGCREWLASRGMTALFDRVELLDRDTPKPAHIKVGGVLIDDSFAERKACEAAGIICFDVDAAGALIQHLQRN